VKLAQVRWRNIQRWAPGVLVSVVALAAVFRLAHWQDFKRVAATIPLLNLFAVAVLSLVAFAVRALAWRVLLAWRAGFRRSFFLINLGYFLNNVLPLRAGEIGRAIFMGSASGLGTFRVLSSIVVERSFDMVMAAGLLLATLPLVLDIARARATAAVTMILVILGLVALFLIARNAAKVHLWVSGLRFPLVQKWIVPHLDSLLDGFQPIMQRGRFLLSATLIALSWLLWVCMYYLILLPIAPQFPFYGAIFISAVLALGVAIPAAPGGLGIYEASAVGSLALFGISPSASLAVALWLRLLQFTITGILGFYELVHNRHSISVLFEKAKTLGGTGKEVFRSPSRADFHGGELNKHTSDDCLENSCLTGVDSAPLDVDEN
jgi:uncharacterized protein (TIRG00374 family)